MYHSVIDGVLSAWNEGKLDELDPVVDARVVRRASPGLNSDAASLNQLKDVITKYRRAFPDLKVTIDEIHFEGNRSFAIWTFRGTNTGPGDFPSTGKPVTLRGSSFGRYKDGRMIEELVFADSLDMMTQLGFTLAPPSGV